MPTARAGGNLGAMAHPLDSAQLDPYESDSGDVPRILTWSQARAYGYSRSAIEHRVRTGRWQRLLPRTYLAGDTITPRDRLHAALAYAGPGSALSGTAALHESGVRRVQLPSRVLVVVPASSQPASTARVEISRSSRPLKLEPWGLRRVSPARAATDLALRSSSIDDVRTIVARVVQGGYCTLAAIGDELEAGPRRGSALLRQTLTEVGWGAASAPEARAASILRRAGVGDFIQNARIRLPSGQVRVIDFYWPRLRACLEIDSVEWHREPTAWSQTWDRHLELTTLGFSVIHRPPSAVKESEQFTRDIQRWLAARAQEIALPRT